MKTIKLNYNDSIPNNFTGIIEFPDGTKKWYKEGKYHREDGPAIEYPNGRKAWYKEGKCHRENGPAVEYPDGRKFWLKEDKLHRLDGPAIESTTEYKEWHIEGNPHSPKILSKLINSCLFLGKEKGQYDLEWLKFLTEEGIEEFPIMPGMKEYKDFKKVLRNWKEWKIQTKNLFDEYIQLLSLGTKGKFNIIFFKMIKKIKQR